jgi:hypothetical protein
MTSTLIERDLSCAAAARLIGMDRNELARRIRNGEIPTGYVTPGGRYKVAPSGLARWVEERGK